MTNCFQANYFSTQKYWQGAGILGAIVVTWSIESMLFDVKRADPLTYAAVVLLLSLIAMMACQLPARKAARLSPIVALHED